jgi:hypothetical protein
MPFGTEPLTPIGEPEVDAGEPDAEATRDGDADNDAAALTDAATVIAMRRSNRIDMA